MVKAKLRFWYTQETQPNIYRIDWRCFRRTNKPFPDPARCSSCGLRYCDCKMPISHGVPVIDKIPAALPRTFGAHWSRPWFSELPACPYSENPPLRTRRPVNREYVGLPIVSVWVGKSEGNNCYIRRHAERLKDTPSLQLSSRQLPLYPGLRPHLFRRITVKRRSALAWSGRFCSPLPTRYQGMKGVRPPSTPAQIDAFLVNLGLAAGIRCRLCRQYLPECQCHATSVPEIAAGTKVSISEARQLQNQYQITWRPNAEDCAIVGERAPLRPYLRRESFRPDKSRPLPPDGLTLRRWRRNRLWEIRGFLNVMGHLPTDRRFYLTGGTPEPNTRPRYWVTRSGRSGGHLVTLVCRVCRETKAINPTYDTNRQLESYLCSRHLPLVEVTKWHRSSCNKVTILADPIHPVQLL